MSNFFRAVFHVGAVIFQVANVAAPFIPQPYGAVVAAGVGLAQAVIDLRKKQEVPK